MSYFEIGALLQPSFQSGPAAGPAAGPAMGPARPGRVVHPGRQPPPAVPARLPPRPARQTPAQAQARVRAAKDRENLIRRQAQGTAAQAKVDQHRAIQKQAEINRLRKAVRDCGVAVARARIALRQFMQTPRPAARPAQIIHDSRKRQLEGALQAALVALQAARTALEAVMRAANAVAESPAQQAVSLINAELEAAKRATQEEVAAAVEAGVPASTLPSTTTTEQQTDAQVSEVAKDAATVAEQTVGAAEDAAKESDKSATEAEVPPGPPPPTGAEAPVAEIEAAARDAQEAVNQAVGAKPGSVLPILAIAGVLGYFFFRKD